MELRKWWEQQDLNPHRSGYEPLALPFKLYPQRRIVGLEGLEPSTQNRSIQLSYKPICKANSWLTLHLSFGGNRIFMPSKTGRRPSFAHVKGKTGVSQFHPHMRPTLAQAQD